MDNLTIEVGIPTANNEDTIRTTLQSLINQRRKPDRIIIVDDSTDSTPEIVRDVARTTEIPIDLFSQSVGRGVGGARREIYERFQGDILACIDTDNKLGASWLAEHANFHTEHSDFGILSNTSGLNRAVSNPKDSDYFGQSNCSLTRDALQTVDGWDRWFPRGEDWDMRIRLWRAGVNSYAKREINTTTQQIGTEGEGTLVERVSLWVSKKISAPSSAYFLKKYGSWYLQFHPKHVVGDLLSIFSLLSVVLSPLLLVFGYPLLTLVSVGMPLLFSVVYAYHKGPRKRAGLDLQKDDITAIPIFFVLSVSFMSSLVALSFNEFDWNYAGVQEDDAGT